MDLFRLGYDFGCRLHSGKVSFEEQDTHFGLNSSANTFILA